MIESFKLLVSTIGYAIETAGVIILVLGIVSASRRARSALPLEDRDAVFSRFRHEFAQSTLVALDFLVAGDIIRTVIVSHTLENILALALLVTIRTALVFTLHMELEGRWPWQKAAPAPPKASDPD